MARLSTGQTYGATGRRTPQQLLGGTSGSAPQGGELAQRPLSTVALQPQAQPVNTFIQAGSPTLGGPVRMFAPPDLPAPSRDMANLAQALSSFNPALQQVSEVYAEDQKQRDKLAQQQGATTAAQIMRVAPGFSNFREAIREVEKRSATDPSLIPLLTELRAKDPEVQRYAAEELQDALAKQSISSAKVVIDNMATLPDGRPLETVDPDDPAFLGLVMSTVMPTNTSPSVWAKNKDNAYAVFGSLRADQAKRRADHKDEQVRMGFNRGVSGDVTLVYANMMDSQQFAAEFGKRLTAVYANSRPGLYREVREKSLDNLAEAIVAVTGGDLKAMDRMAPVIAEAIELAPAGPNGEPLIEQFGKPRQAVINDFYRKLTTGLNTDRDLQDKMDSARGQETADADLQQFLPPEVLNDPAQLQSRLDALPQFAQQRFPNDPEAQLAYMERVQKFATGYSRAYIAPIQRDTAAQEYANQALNPSSDPNADIQRYTQMFQARLIDEADYKSLIAGARSRNEKRNDNSYQTLRGLQRDLQQQLTDQYRLTTEGDGTVAVTPEEAAQIRQAIGQFYRAGEEMILKNPGANLDQQLGNLFQTVTQPAITRGQQQSQQPLYKSPGAVGLLLGPGRGDAATVAKVRRQVDVRPLYSSDTMAKQLDNLLTGKPLDPETRKVLKQLQMKPSDFFIKQMQLHGIPLDAPIQQQLRKLDGSDLVSSAQPMGGTGGLGMIQPGRTASMAQRMWQQWSTALNNAVMPPAAAAPMPMATATRGSRPFTGDTGSNQVAARMLPPQTRALLRTIRFAEGTAHQDGYRTMFTGTKFNDLSRHPRRINRSGDLASDAAGAYQFLSTTWDSVSGGAMTPVRQDLAAVKLIRTRGVDPNLPKGFTVQVADKLSPEWASFPTARTGTSYYGQGGKSFQQLKAYYDRVLKEEMARGR